MSSVDIPEIGVLTIDAGIEVLHADEEELLVVEEDDSMFVRGANEVNITKE